MARKPRSFTIAKASITTKKMPAPINSRDSQVGLKSRRTGPDVSGAGTLDRDEGEAALRTTTLPQDRWTL
jgi:hypothetical protein